MERRLSPRLAHAAHARAKELLPGLCRDAARPYHTGAVVRVFVPGRDLGASWRPRTRRALGQAVAARLRKLSAEPRPDRQPSAWRTPVLVGRSGAAHGGACDHPAGPDAAAAVHGRGVGIDAAISVLLRFHGRLGE